MFTPTISIEHNTYIRDNNEFHYTSKVVDVFSLKSADQLNSKTIFFHSVKIQCSYLVVPTCLLNLARVVLILSTHTSLAISWVTVGHSKAASLPSSYM